MKSKLMSLVLATLMVTASVALAEDKSLQDSPYPVTQPTNPKDIKYSQQKHWRDVGDTLTNITTDVEKAPPMRYHPRSTLQNGRRIGFDIHGLPYLYNKGSLLAEYNFAHQFLASTDFSNDSLIGANFEGAVLMDAQFRWANLTEANLRGADLQRADLRRANLFGADLRNARMAHARLDHAVLINTKYNKGTFFPYHFTPEHHGMVYVPE